MTCLSTFLIIQNENLIFKLLFIYFESFRLELTDSFVHKNINISKTDTTEVPFHPWPALGRASDFSPALTLFAMTEE